MRLERRLRHRVLEERADPKPWASSRSQTALARSRCWHAMVGPNDTAHLSAPSRSVVNRGDRCRRGHGTARSGTNVSVTTFVVKSSRPADLLCLPDADSLRLDSEQQWPDHERERRRENDHDCAGQVIAHRVGETPIEPVVNRIFVHDSLPLVHPSRREVTPSRARRMWHSPHGVEIGLCRPDPDRSPKSRPPPRIPSRR